MTNNEIAQFLYEISEMLEIKGESQFRVLAYKNAGRAIEHLASDIEDIYRKEGLEGLEKIEGIGESIAAKLAELIETGKCQYYDDLAKDIPKSELALMRIPGIGPRTAKKLYESLQIKNISDLEEAAKQGRIRTLEGFDLKAEERILRNINRLKKIEKRMLISFARPLAEEMVEYLKKHCPEVEKVDIVGSLRRWKETIGDIDLVASSKHPQKVIECFVKFPKAKQIISQGETKAAILHQKADTQIDLEILRPESYGSLLQHLTGSKEHNISLRRYANELGLSLSEYGILDLKTKKREIFSDEESFYRRLGLAYLEPEMRENRGEIELAQTGRLPKLVKVKDIQGLVHVHTKYSEGSLTVEEVVKRAYEAGYQYIVISDHTAGLGVAKGVNQEKLLKQLEEIKALNEFYQKKGFRIFTGLEVNIKADGSLDFEEEILKKLDVVIASVHSSFDQPEEVATERLLKAIRNPQVDILGHPSSRILLKRMPLEIDWPIVFEACQKTHTVLEINCHPERLDLSDDLVFEARKYGLKFVISSDLHQAENLNNVIYGVAVARRGWLEKKDVINTYSAQDFLKALKNH